MNTKKVVLSFRSILRGQGNENIKQNRVTKNLKTPLLNKMKGNKRTKHSPHLKHNITVIETLRNLALVFYIQHFSDIRPCVNLQCSHHV